MAEFVALSPTLGINVALIASWQDVPNARSPYTIVTYAACAANSQGTLQPMTEEYYGEAREALLQYFAANATGSSALPPTTEGG